MAGTILNPALFFVLAFGEERSDAPIYRATALLSFTMTSGSLAAPPR